MADINKAMQSFSDNQKAQPNVNDGEPQRLSKSLAQYQELSRNPKMERCGNCPLYLPGGYCRFVYGKINTKGWCNLWGFKKLANASPQEFEQTNSDVRRLHLPHGPNGPSY